ncbi:hypothetical protein LPB248_12985 [Flavobacterium sp. LPB0248]|uniref:lanthionine synthetase LanC family protein n=1 Tax=Flavobacterium sp. LPB0248 TaxID=2614441 RepID=UPI0015A66CE0|nr:lanthionine synthetase LanC family protein [Flavobacterium sp. LPB0248]QLC67181.1 hypothetical protein LPB248_12985 [Flavobacterium sp. LPB0248]
MTDLLKKIDKILFEAAKKMESPVINDDLGVLIYFATRYNATGEILYKRKSVYLLNKLISVFGDYDFSSGSLDGFEGVFWTISYLKKCNIINDSREFLEGIEDSLFQSIQNDINNNMYEVFYGSIGKIQYFLEEDRINEAKVIILINDLINSLWSNKEESDGQIYWIDNVTFKKDFEFIDLGLAHGICSVFLFLVKLKELKFDNEHLDSLINGIVRTYQKAENEVKGTSFFPDRYSIKNKHKNLINSRLAYCVGDLPISFAFCYAGQVINNKEWIEYSKNIIRLSTFKEVSSSNLKQFQEYDFFDIGFCHGISSILYLFYQINKYHNDDFICFKTEYWKNELILNVGKFIKIKEPIYYAKSFNQIEDKRLHSKNSILNGLCGAALVLLAIEYDETDWSSFLCLY